MTVPNFKSKSLFYKDLRRVGKGDMRDIMWTPRVIILTLSADNY